MTSASAGGLGVSAFLKHTGDSGGGGKWLRNWRKNGSGKAVVWLHTRAPIVPCMSHSFMLEDEYDDKDTGRPVDVLRYPRFVSPDPEIVHKNQFFRHDDGTMKVPPDLDPFLLLREWLRGAEHIGLDDTIFEWKDAKNRKVILWNRGELSGLVKRGRNNYYSTLDTKIEYIYVVVDNDDIEAGPVLAREGKLLSQNIADVINRQREMFGEDAGDPLQKPYAFGLKADGDAPSPMKKFTAFKHEAAEFSDQVWEQISSEEFPDPIPHGQPGDGDMAKIRDAFEKAARIDLPLDAIFSEDGEERRDLMRQKSSRGAPRSSKAAQSRTQQVPPPQAASKPTSVTKPSAAAAQPPESMGPQTRRRKVDKPAEPPPVETIPCDDCQAPMLATDTKCAGCGAEYEPVPDAPQKPSPAANQNAKPTTTSTPKPGPVSSVKAKPETVGAKPTPAVAAVQDVPAQPVVGDGNCWSCGVDVNGQAICPSCGIDQGDEIPF